MALLELLRRLDAVEGPSGAEEPVIEAVLQELDGCYDGEPHRDALGSLVVTRGGAEGAPTLLLAAHVDELGFLVQHVDEEGFLRLVPVGYHDERIAANQVVHVHGERGPVRGVIATTPFHLLSAADREAAIHLSDLFVDVGATSAAEAEALGVRVGHHAVVERTGELLNGTKVYSGRAVDDRAGCAVVVELLQRLRGRELPVTVQAAFTVLEELGVRGAGPVGAALQPDCALAVDVTLCADVPGVEFHRAPIRFGGGPCIKYWDFVSGSGNGSAVPRRLTERLEQAAQAAGVEWQREVLHGGVTDAAAIARSGHGVLAGAVSIPSRYVHSSVGTVHLDDLEGAVALLEAFVGRAGWLRGT